VIEIKIIVILTSILNLTLSLLVSYINLILLDSLLQEN